MLATILLKPLVPEAIGRMGGSCLWAFIILIGITKCIAIAKREGTNTKCVAALACLLSGWLLSSISSALSNVMTLPRLVAFASIGLLVISITCCVLLAILGLAECKQSRLFTQGRKQAIWALVLAAVMLSLAAGGFWSGYSKARTGTSPAAMHSQAVDGYHTFEELNFRMKEPPRGWRKIDMSPINPDVTFAMRRVQPEVIMMIIAENLGTTEAISPEAMIEFVTATIRSSATAYTIDSQTPLTINGIDGCLIKDHLTLGAKRLYYNRWFAQRGGIFYQVVTGGDVIAKSAIERESVTMRERFEIIDPDLRPSHDSHSLTDHESANFGYSMSDVDEGWLAWDDFQMENPEADFGGICPTKNMGFLMVPLLHDDLPVDADHIFTALHRSIGMRNVERSAKPLNIKQEDGLHTRTVAFTMQVGNTSYDYQSTVWTGRDRSLFLWVWAPANSKDLTREASALRESVHVAAPMSTKPTMEMLSPGQCTAHAGYFDSLGWLFLDVKQFDPAVKAFQRAAALLPNTTLYVENALGAYRTAGKQAEGLRYLATVPARLATNPVIQAWKAALLQQTDRSEEAKLIYQRIFAAGYQDVDDLQSYAELLAESDEWEACEALLADYFTRDGALSTKLVQADLYVNHAKYDQAIATLMKLQTEHQIHPDISYRLIDSHSKQGEFTEALAVSEAMITNGYATSGAYYQQALAQYNLGWYKRAKATLEQAQRLSPNDQTIQEFLTTVSGTLGEGNNSNIKQEIPPVALPHELEAACAAPATLQAETDSGAMICSDVHGFLFDRGGRSRSTQYRRIRVLNKAGVAQHSTLKVSFDPLSEDIFVNTLKVRSKTGETISQGATRDYYVIDDRQGYEASHDKTLCIPVANLQPGCEIELTVTRRSFGDATQFAFQRILLTSRLPTLFRACYYVGDPAAIAHHALNGIMEQSVSNGVIWRVSEPRPYEDEIMEPRLEETEPILLLGDATVSWKSDTEKYLERIKARFASEPSVTALAKRLTRGVTSLEERIDLILTHVQKEYTYKPIEFGSRGVLPFPASETIRRRYGDCKDHAVLARQLLDALSINASLVLVNSQFNTIDSVPTLDQFNHMILYVPAKRGCKFVDLTQKYSAPHDLVPAGLAGKVALIAQPGNIRFRTIPAYQTGANRAESAAEVTISGTAIFVQERLTLSGHPAAWLRPLLDLDSKERLLWAQQVVSRYEPYARIDTFVIADAADSDDLILTSTYQISNRCRQQAGKTILPLPNIWGQYYSEYRPMQNRSKPFVMEYSFALTSETRIVSDVLEVTTDSDEKGAEVEGANWKVTRRQTAKGHLVRLSYDYTPGSYAADRYSEFVTTMEEAIRSAKAEIELRPRKLSAIPPEKTQDTQQKSKMWDI